MIVNGFWIKSSTSGDAWIECEKCRAQAQYSDVGFAISAATHAKCCPQELMSAEETAALQAEWEATNPDDNNGLAKGIDY